MCKMLPFIRFKGIGMAKIRLGVIGAGGIVCRLQLPGLTEGIPCRTSVINPRNNIALIINIVKSYTDHAQIPSER